MRLLMFQDRFFSLVCEGRKQQTVRAERKDGWRPEVGELLQVARWTGKPYRSKVERGPVVRVTDIKFIHIGREAIFLNSELCSIGGCEELAKADGFTGLKEMMAWFEEVHGLPFAGVCIGFELVESESVQ